MFSSLIGPIKSGQQLWNRLYFIVLHKIPCPKVRGAWRQAWVSARDNFVINMKDLTKAAGHRWLLWYDIILLIVNKPKQKILFS